MQNQGGIEAAEIVIVGSIKIAIVVVIVVRAVTAAPVAENFATRIMANSAVSEAIDSTEGLWVTGAFSRTIWLMAMK